MNDCVCKAGFTKNAGDVHELLFAPLSRSLSTAVSKQCEVCQVGSYKSALGDGACQPCEAGKYNQYTGRTSCVLCEPGKRGMMEIEVSKRAHREVSSGNRSVAVLRLRLICCFCDYLTLSKNVRLAIMSLEIRRGKLMSQVARQQMLAR